MSIRDVTDVRSNLNDQIAHAVRILGRSKHRLKLFEAIYEGKKQIKTQTELRQKSGLSKIRILQEGKKLSANHIVEAIKVDGETAFKKDPFYSNHKSKVLSLVKSKKKFSEFPTKINPNPRVNQKELRVNINFPRKAFNVKQITVDEIQSFKKVRKIRKQNNYFPVVEKKFKNGIKKIIGEKGKFQDWGGESNDLYTTRLTIKGGRVAAAFAFKGRGTRGILRPSMMGKNGDQILRLFQSNAEVFILQYWAQVDQSIYESMHHYAIARSAILQKKLSFCIIDGADTQRIFKAYSKFF